MNALTTIRWTLAIVVTLTVLWLLAVGYYIGVDYVNYWFTR